MYEWERVNESDSAPSRRLDIEQLRRLLNTMQFGIGERLVYEPIVDSTNVYAMKLAQAGSEEGVVVLTDSQTAGKGRQGRRWVDVAGSNALTSTIVRPLFPPYLLVMAASLAVHTTLVATCNVAAAIKWPNDILIGERKVAGILIETSYQRSTGQLIAVLGIGINVNGHVAQLAANERVRTSTSAELATRAITLEEACGHTVSREALIAQLLQQLEHSYLALQQEVSSGDSGAPRPISRLLRETWRSHLSMLGRTVEVRQGNHHLSGVAEDVNETGELLLRLHSGDRITITWGDVAIPR